MKKSDVLKVRNFKPQMYSNTSRWRCWSKL